MKVLYCNPSFWEYRLPFYVELNKLFQGSFYITYSTRRYQEGKEGLLRQIKEKMGKNAIPLGRELMFDWKHMTFNSIWKGVPFPLGLFSLIKRISPDVLITEGFFQWTPWVQLWALIHRVPVFVGYERTMWTERNNSKLKTWIRKMQDKLIAGYLVNGSETKKYLMSIGVSSEKIFIGGMSADSKGLLSSIATMNTEEKTSLRNNFTNGAGLIFLFSGRVSVLKGANLLLSAWEKHILKYPHDHIILIGYGDLSDRMEWEYKDFSSVHLMGKVDYNEVHRYYAISDVFILPTLTDNWSLVIPEAMSCGLPVATSIYNGCHPELIHEGENGCTFDTFKQESILKALDYFHHVDLKEHGEKSIELEKVFNTENSAKRTYKALIGYKEIYGGYKKIRIS